MHNVDEILNEIGINVSAFTRFKQWLMPIDARDYRVVTRKLLERQKQLQSSPARFAKAAH